MGLSVQSAARLRRACLTLEVPGWLAKAVTLTTHREVDGEEYKRIWKRWRMRCARAGVSGIYRHEMQRRGTPHSHVVLWVPPRPAGLMQDLLAGWLACAGEERDGDAWRYAFKCRTLENQDRWGVYMALHQAKGGQAGYPGKQWGTIGKSRLVEREHRAVSLTRRESVELRRRLRKWTWAARRRKVRTGPVDGRLLWGLGASVPAALVRGLGTEVEEGAKRWEARRGFGATEATGEQLES